MTSEGLTILQFMQSNPDAWYSRKEISRRAVSRAEAEENPQWATQYGVQGIPTLLFVFGGKIVHRQVGALPERMLRDVVSQFIDVTAPKAA